MAAEAQVVNNPDAGKYEVTLGGEPAGFAAYRLEDSRNFHPH